MGGSLPDPLRSGPHQRDAELNRRAALFGRCWQQWTLQLTGCLGTLDVESIAGVADSLHKSLGFLSAFAFDLVPICTAAEQYSMRRALRDQPGNFRYWLGHKVGAPMISTGNGAIQIHTQTFAGFVERRSRGSVSQCFRALARRHDGCQAHKVRRG